MEFGSAVLPWAHANIMPLGDIQYNGPDGPCDLARLRRTIKIATEKNCYFVLMGDYIDFLSPSNRVKLQMAGLYDVSVDVIDNAATILENELFRELAPLKGRVLGVVEGHHYYTHLDGSTTGTRLTHFLNDVENPAVTCLYGGDAFMYRINFHAERGKKGRAGVITKIFVSHGAGGGSTISAGLPKLERFMAYTAAQVVFVGHNHKTTFNQLPAMDMTGAGKPRMKAWNRALVQTGSFLKGWQEGSEVGGRPQGGYVERALMPPVALGTQIVTLEPHRTDERHSERGQKGRGTMYEVLVYNQTLRNVS